MQYEPDAELLKEVIHLLTSHGLVVVAVDTERGELVVRIPAL